MAEHDSVSRPDFEAEGLLDGLDGEVRAARQRLLVRLFEAGASLEQLRGAVMLPAVTPLMEYLLNRHMQERLRHQAVSLAMLESGNRLGARDIAVGFADLVGFTRLGEQLAAEQVGGVAARLSELASHVA